MRHTKLASFISTALYLASLCVLSACDNNHGIRKTTYVTAQSRSEPAQSARTITSNIQVRFNEVVSSNITLKDEYDDTPDWIELYNSTRDGLSLKGWSISDNIDKPDKWTFGAATITAKGYLKIWASGKDQTNIGHYKTYLSLQDTFSYTLPTEGVDESWTHLSFNDSSWQQGLPGFGFGYADDTTLLPEGTISVFIRKKFTATHIDTIKQLILDMDYDDGFIAYINGHEIARNHMDALNPSYSTLASSKHDATLHLGEPPERFIITNPSTFLNEGENVFSVQVHNNSSASSDLSARPFLSALYFQPTTDGYTPPDILSFPTLNHHTNFKISSAGETLYLHNSTGRLIDTFNVKPTPPGSSVGRSVRDDATVYFDQPTPGEQNPKDEYTDYTQSKIIFSDDGGVTDAVNLSLSGAGSLEKILYTLDSTKPSKNSLVYSSPIPLTSNTVVRARIFRDGAIPSKTQTNTYLINKNHDIPIITLVTEPDNFFHEDTGIYVLGPNYERQQPNFGANFWQDKESDIHFTLYETNGDLGIAFDAGVKIFGAWSRANAQRSLAIFARKYYGTPEINHLLFPQLNYTAFQSLVLRNSGNDWMRTMLRDAMSTSLMDGSGLDTQAYRPASVYLNGNYWGLYNLREKVNNHFIASKHQVKTKDIDLLEANGDIVDGDNSEYNALINFMEIHDLSDNANYQTVTEKIDIDNYIIYQVAQIYFNNVDWPGNNIKFWKSPETKWRWILYDTDFGFGIWADDDYLNNTLSFALAENTVSWPNPLWSTFLFRNLIKNEGFTKQFVNRFADELNSRFLPLKVSQHIDTLANVISSEIPKHTERWKPNQSSGIIWSDEIDNMKVYGNERPYHIKQHILNTFNLTAIFPLTIEIKNPTQGSVQLNSLTISATEWTGDYFEGVPITLTAIPKPGFVFSAWTGASTATEITIQLNPLEAQTISPVFVAE